MVLTPDIDTTLESPLSALREVFLRDRFVPEGVVRIVTVIPYYKYGSRVPDRAVVSTQISKLDRPGVTSQLPIILLCDTVHVT